MIRNSAINLILKIGLALSSIVFAILSYVQASSILAYYPNFIISIFGEIPSLIIGSIIALLLAFWILSRKHKFAAAFSYVIMLGIGMLANITSFTFVAITWPLFCIAIALSLRYYPRIRVIIPAKNGEEEKMKIVPATPAEKEAMDTDNLANAPIAETITEHEAIKEEIESSTPSHSNPTLSESDAEMVQEEIIEKNDHGTMIKPVSSHELRKDDRDNEYGIEVPYEEVAPRNDEEHRYSPLGTIADQFIMAQQESIANTETAEAKEFIFNDHKESYASPFQSEVSEEVRQIYSVQEKPKRQYRKKAIATEPIAIPIIEITEPITVKKSRKKTKVEEVPEVKKTTKKATKTKALEIESTETTTQKAKSVAVRKSTKKVK